MGNIFPYNFITIEGNIGAGKTTLSKMLSKRYNTRLILEQFADNPFLPFFYENQERYAFTVELFFMTERHKQLQENLQQQSLFHDLVIADYFFLKTLLYAQTTLKGEEFRLFKKLFDILNSTFANPDILLYLHRSTDNLLENIKNRGRDYEKNITADYLNDIRTNYFDFFKSTGDIPIIILDVTGISFQHDEHAFQTIANILMKKYEIGVHHISLGEAMGSHG